MCRQGCYRRCTVCGSIRFRMWPWSAAGRPFCCFHVIGCPLFVQRQKIVGFAKKKDGVSFPFEEARHRPWFIAGG